MSLARPIKDSTSSLILQQQSWTKFVAARGPLVAAKWVSVTIIGPRSSFCASSDTRNYVAWVKIQFRCAEGCAIVSLLLALIKIAAPPSPYAASVSGFITNFVCAVVIFCPSHWHWRSHLSRNLGTSLYLHHSFFVGRPVGSRTHRLPV